MTIPVREADRNDRRLALENEIQRLRILLTFDPSDAEARELVEKYEARLRALDGNGGDDPERASLG